MAPIWVEIMCVTLLREQGLTMDTLFVELPEPAARELGADATTPEAPTAVPAAQLLYDAGDKHGWNGLAPAG